MATKTTTNLELNFATAEGKTKKITLHHAKKDLTADQVKSAMETVIAKNIFMKDNVDQYARVKNACYVSRTVDSIYTTPKAA